MDDDIAIIFKELPQGVFLTMLSDSCHSGTISKEFGSNPHEWNSKFLPPPFDIATRSLGRNLKVKHIGAKEIAGREDTQRHILLSGCRDDQTSADAFDGGKWGGALTTAFVKVVLEHPEWDWTHVHSEVVKRVAAGGYTQAPQLSGMVSLRERVVFGGVA